MAGRWKTLLACLGLLLSLASPLKAEPLSEALLGQSSRLLMEGKAKEALSLLDAAETTPATSPGLLALRNNFQARALENLGRPMLALKKIQAGVALLRQLPPGDKQRMMGLGALLGQEALLRRSVWRPDHEAFLKNWRTETSPPLSRLVKAASDLGQSRLAVSWSRELAAAEPLSFTASQILVNTLLEAGSAAQALSAAATMKKLAASDEDRAGAAVSEALVWITLLQPAQARQVLEKQAGKNLSPLMAAKLSHTRAIALALDGRATPALALLDKAFSISQSLKDNAALLVKEGRVPPAFFRDAEVKTLDLQTGLWAERARINLLLGRFKEARDNYTQALALHPPFGQQLQMLTSRGVVLERQGFARSALVEHNNVASLAARSGLWRRVAESLNNQATAAREAGLLTEALRRQWAALWVDDLMGDLSGKAVDYENIARLWLLKNKPALARGYIQKAKRTQKEADYLLKLRFGRTEGEACRRLGDTTCAKRVFAETAQEAATGGALDFLWMAQAGLARSLRDEGALSESAGVFEAALTTIDTMRLLSGASAEERARFLLERLPVYEDLMRVYLKQGRFEEAFATLERMRARTLLDRLQQSGSRLDEELTPNERDTERLLELATRLSFEELNTTRAPEARRRYEETLARLENHRRLLDKKYPKLAFFRGRGGRPSPGVVAKYLAPKDLLLIQHTTEEGTVLFGLGKTRFQTWEIPALKKSALRLLVQDRLRASIAQGVWAMPQERAAQGLYRTLLEPVLATFQDTDTLLFSPDEILSELPLGVLMTPDGQFLAQKMAVLNVPSATTWTYSRSLRGAPSKKSQWLVLANPRFADKALAPLKGTEVEARKLKSLYPGPVQLFTQQQATENTIQKRGDKAALLHFATHGLLNAANPMMSKVALARDDRGGGDGFLEVREILDLDLRASLVVLSACDSARGEALAGEGLQGLAQAFLRAGAPRVMATLWEVNDQSTSFLVQHFYANLKKQSVARALQSAQQQTMAKFGPNPFFWAPFVLLGPGWEGDLGG